MDSIFQLNEDDRAAFLQHICQTLSCTFICLWTYLPQPTNCLLFMDGIYHEEHKQQSLSAGITRGRGLFNEYQKSVIILDNDAPGLAFKNNLPYIEFKEYDFQSLASTQTQLQFYQEAAIKTAIFMGCKIGEIELGMSIDTQANIELEIRNLFPEDFLRQAIPLELSQPNDQNPPSSSSSSMRSLSIDSPEGIPSNFLYNIHNNILEPPLQPSAQLALSNPAQETIQNLSGIRHIHQFPTTMLGNDDAAMTQAILAVISSSSPTSCTSLHQPFRKASAFKNYRSVLSTTGQNTGRINKTNMLKRAIEYYRSSLSVIRASQEQMIQNTNRPTSNQLHHMISERKRREKLNESFQALRSLLPPGSKKDKASVLSGTTEYMNSLKAEVEELTRKNQTLKAQLLQGTDDHFSTASSSLTSDQSVDVRITNINSGTLSRSRTLDLSIIVRGDYCSMLDLTIRVIEFLKQLLYISILSLQADMPMVETASFIRVIFRLKIEEGGDWNETTFQEAVRDAVSDLAH